MKVFQLLMHNTEEHEYLHIGPHGSTSLCNWSQKCNQLILLPSSVSQNNLSVNSLLRPKHTRFCLRSEYVGRPAHTSGVRNPLFALPWKHPLKKPKGPIRPKVCAESLRDPRKFTACRLSSDKSVGQNEREIGVLTESVEWASSRATNCFHPLHYAALTRLKPHINYQSPQWNIYATAVPFLPNECSV